MSEAYAPCTFCQVIAGQLPAAVVWEDKDTLAFLDLRQPNAGHTLVVPKAHVADLRGLDMKIATSVMATLVRVTRAVDASFPNEGLSLWHSIGPAAFQEVPHLHWHILPRRHADGLLQIYPAVIQDTALEDLELVAEQIRRCL